MESIICDIIDCKACATIHSLSRPKDASSFSAAKQKSSDGVFFDYDLTTNSTYDVSYEICGLGVRKSSV
jgi:hypothetical protein